MNQNTVEQLVHATQAIGAQLGKFLESRLVDPLEPYLGEHGQIWEPLGNGTDQVALQESSTPYINETGLTQVRRACRFFARENPFAVNGHENRISYIVGIGHMYSVVDRYDDSATAEQKSRVQEIIDEFIQANHWHHRQAEVVFRLDRDGEVFLRMFEGEDGILRVRFVEPAAVTTPTKLTEDPHCTYGIRTDPDDQETVLEYYVNGETVPADEIQHRKRGTSDAKRGTPIYWVVRKNLVRALKILRNGSTVTEIQTAIAMVRKFVKTAGATVQAWQQAQSDASVDRTATGEPDRLYQKYEPGSIINASGNIEYEFPSMGIDPSRYIESLQAELRAIAACLVMTESMFSAKTDDTSRAAAEVSEGPVSRNFERLQNQQVQDDLEIMRRQLQLAVAAGRITQADVDATMITAEGPSLDSRDPKAESERHAIDIAAGKLSIQTACTESGYDYEKEMRNIESHNDRVGVIPPGPPLPPDDEEDPENTDPPADPEEPE